MIHKYIQEIPLRRLWNMWDSLFEGIFFLLFKGNDTYLRVLIPLQTTPSPYTLHPTPSPIYPILSLSLSLSLQDSLHDIFSFSKKHKTPDFHHKFVSFAPSFFFLKKNQSQDCSRDTVDRRREDEEGFFQGKP